MKVRSCITICNNLFTCTPFSVQNCPMESMREIADAHVHKVIDSIKSTAGYAANGEVARILILWML